MTKRVTVLDTTLRDGAQREGISLSAKDKVRIAQRLDALGVTYIEGGYPGSNPKDVEFFRRARDMAWQHSKVAAFGNTRRAGIAVEDDTNVQAMRDAGVHVAVIVGKASTMHVTDVLRTTLDENLAMIAETVAYLRAEGLEVIFDAEHYFDGYKLDRAYAIDCLRAAHEAGAGYLVLCDTNGGTLPSGVAAMTQAAVQTFPEAQIGMHAHDDLGVAVANTLIAVESGATHVQGTMNGYGERCGNANLCTVIPALETKMGTKALANGSLPLITKTSHYVAEIANLNPDDNAPFVGHSAFAHKAGLHVSALAKNIDTYQHMDPVLVGNEMRVLVSELSGRGNIAHKVAELDMDVELDHKEISDLTDQVKSLESAGFQFEGAEGSFELLIHRSRPDYKPFFEVLDFMVVVEKRKENPLLSEATVKARVNGAIMHTAAEGDGPVNALDAAMRKALLPYYPELDPVQLVDFKVRILDPQAATAAVTRVLIDASDGETSWSTVGCSVNIIEACFQALIDSLELPLIRRASAECSAAR